MESQPTAIEASTAEPPLVLAIDIGSSSTRVLVYDRLGHTLEGASAREQSRLQTTPEGAVELDPDSTMESVARCVDAVLVQLGAQAQRIGAVAVDTLVSNIMAVDGEGQSLTPLITYADTRDDHDATDLRRSMDEGEVHDRTGCMLRTSYWPARLAWFRRVQPDVWRAAARWITLGEYMELRLFGQCRVSYSVASWSGLLDRSRLTWDRALIERLGVRLEQLSPLVDADAPLRGLMHPYTSRWPALREVPWFAAVGDGAAANVGSGCTGRERVALTIGTTGAMRAALTEVERVPPSLWCYRLDGRYSLVGGATSEGGNVYSWLQRTLQVGTASELEAAVEACPPDSHGLTILPFFAGERSPGWAGDVPATIHGLTLATTPTDIVRASLESVAYRFALIEEEIGRLTEGNHRLVASGGALLASPVWMQIFADVLGREVVASAEPEATGRGAALMALYALGALPAFGSVPAVDGATHHPDRERHLIYQAAIARQKLLYERMRYEM